MNIFKRKNTIGIKDIDVIENYFSISLPRDYVEYILTNNGKGYANAYINYRSKEIPYSRNVSLKKSDKYSIYDIYGKLVDRRYFPFANTGIGDYFCIDLKDNQIVLWLHEKDEFIHLFESFSDLINNLQMY